MTKKQLELQEKIMGLNNYLRDSEINFQRPDKFYDDPNLASLAREIYSLTEASGPFKTAEEIELRNEALVSLQFVKLVNDIRIADEALEKASSDADTTQLAENARIARVRYNLALSGMDETKRISQGIDVKQITWAQTTPLDKMKDNLSTEGIKNAMQSEAGKKRIDVLKNTFGPGGLAAFTALIPNADGKGYSIDVLQTTKNAVKKLLSDPRMQSMITSYKKAEESWIISATTAGEEFESRLRFMNAHSDELRSLYFMINTLSSGPDTHKAINEALEEAGIRELLKDHKSLRDPENIKMDYLLDDSNSFDKALRADYVKNANLVQNLTDNSGLKEVHRYFYRHGDYGTGLTGDVTKISKQVRPFLDNFMAMPEHDQLKALYMLEHRAYRPGGQAPTDDELKDYHPDVKKIHKVLTANPMKFWKRANSSYMYWQKLKTCLNIAQYKELPKPELTKTQKAVKAVKKLNIVASMANRCLLGNTTGANALLAANAIIGSVEATKKMMEEKEITSKEQKAEEGLDQVSSLTKTAKKAVTMTILSTKNLKYVKAFQGLSIATSVLDTGEGIAKLVHSKQNVKKVASLGDEIKSIMKMSGLSDVQKGYLKKLETNTRMLKVINRDKVKIATADSVNGSIGLGSSVAMASGLGIVSLAPQIVSGIGTKIAKGIIRSRNTNDVVDAKLYENEDVKKEKLDKTNKNILYKYSKLPDKLRKKYVNKVAQVYGKEDKLASLNRLHAVKESGQINLLSTKNSYIKEIGNDIYQLLKIGAEGIQKNKELSAIDKKLVDLANKFVVATGGKNIDLEKLQVQKPETEKTMVNRLVENMTV